MKRLRWGRRGRLGRRAGASAAVRAHRPGRRAGREPRPTRPAGRRPGAGVGHPRVPTRPSRPPADTCAPGLHHRGARPAPMGHTRLTGHGFPSRKRGLKRKMAPWEDRSAPHPASDSQEPRNHAEVAERTRRAGANDPPRAPNLLRRRIRTVPATSAAGNEHGKRVSEPRVVPVTPTAGRRGAGPAGPARYSASTSLNPRERLLEVRARGLSDVLEQRSRTPHPRARTATRRRRLPRTFTGARPRRAHGE